MGRSQGGEPPEVLAFTYTYRGYLLPAAYDTQRPPLAAKFVVVRHLREGDGESGETALEPNI